MTNQDQEKLTNRGFILARTETTRRGSKTAYAIKMKTKKHGQWQTIMTYASEQAMQAAMEEFLLNPIIIQIQPTQS